MKQSFMYLLNCLKRSYINPYCIQCLRSSSGGILPKVSFCGMLRSSIKVTICLPAAGAYVSFVLFSTLLSINAGRAGPGGEEYLSTLYRQQVGPAADRPVHASCPPNLLAGSSASPYPHPTVSPFWPISTIPLSTSRPAVMNKG